MRRRRGPSSRRRGLHPVTVGAIFVVVIGVALYLAFARSIPFVHHYEIKAVMQDSNQLQPSSPVRIAGVNVGKVTGVKPTGKGTSSKAIVTMTIQDQGRPIHTDATLKIRPRIFLEGNFFVDLSPGTPSAPEIKDGGTIPVSQTSTPVQLDQILSILRSDTREELRTALGQLYQANVAGFATAFNRSLEFQAPAYRYTAIVAEALLGEHPHDLSNLIRAGGTVAGALNNNPPQLQALLTDFDTTANALARKDVALQDTVSELPRTLRAARPALDALDRAFPPVNRFARLALPGVRSSGPTIDALRPLVAQLRGLVQPSELRGLSADLRASTPSLAKLSVRTVPLLGQVRLASSCQNQVILPWTHDRIQDANYPSTGPVYQEAVKFLPGIAGESRSFDANGQYFKVLGTGGLETLGPVTGALSSITDLLKLPLIQQLPLVATILPAIQNINPVSKLVFSTNPPKPSGRPPISPSTPCETQTPPDLRTVPGQGAATP